MTPGRPSWRGWRPAAALLGLALAVSLAANVALVLLLRDTYRRLQAVKLDPTDAARSAAADATPPADPGRARVVLLGDSRIEGWADPPVPADSEAINRGVGGQTTAQVLLRLDRDVLALGPRVVVLQAGVNDLKTLGLFPGRERPIVEGCRANLRAIVDRLRARGVAVVVLTIFPVGPPGLSRRPFWSDATVDAIDDVNRSLLGLAGEGVVVIDCDPALRRGRRIDPALAADALHLNREGYRALDAVVRPALDRVVRDIEAEGQADTPDAVQ